MCRRKGEYIDIRKELRKQAEIDAAKLLTEGDYLFAQQVVAMVEENIKRKEAKKLAKKISAKKRINKI